MTSEAAFISDIHGNLQALDAVIADIRERGITECICLGDIVGYGGNPVECLERVRAICQHSLMGNHDQFAVADDAMPDVKEGVRKAIFWTRDQLNSEQCEWLRSRPMKLDGGDYEAVHASLHRPEEWNYMLQAGDAAQHFKHQVKPVCFIGHTHQPKMWVEGDDRALDTTSLEDLRPDRKQVINVGSVGQPRDKDERACYLVYRRAQRDVWWRRVDYDIEAAQTAIAKAGLPGEYAARLNHGK